MSVLIDTRSLQGAVHFDKYAPTPSDPRKARDLANSVGKRLEVFLRIVEDCGAQPVPSDGTEGELQFSLLSEHRVLAILTRRPICAFGDDELAKIEKYVSKGGNLLLMSNHPPLDHRGRDLCEQDNRLAQRPSFGISLEHPVYPPRSEHIPDETYDWFCVQGQIRRFRLINTDGDNLPKNHAITEDLNGGLVFRNSCRIRCDNTTAKVLAKLPNVTDGADAFAVALDKPAGASSGRVVIVADSGIIGNDDTKFPGPGLIKRGANQQFIGNVIDWLCGKR